MIRNILVGYDASRSSEVAVEQALSLAQATDARIHLATVVEVTDSSAEEELISEGLDLVEAAMPPGEEQDEQEPLLPAPSVDEIKATCAARHVVCEEEVLFAATAGAGLLEPSWLADLLVIGRSSAHNYAAPAHPGRTARYLVNRPIAPTMVCAGQYLEISSVLLPYTASVTDGRALAFTAELCHHLNASLDLVVCDRDRRVAGAALEALRGALRAYHVEGKHSTSLSAPAAAVRNAALEGDFSLIVVPDACKRPFALPWTRNEVVWCALEVPNTAVVAYP